MSATIQGREARIAVLRAKLEVAQFEAGQASRLGELEVAYDKIRYYRNALRDEEGETE